MKTISNCSCQYHLGLSHDTDSYWLINFPISERKYFKNVYSFELIYLIGLQLVWLFQPSISATRKMENKPSKKMSGNLEYIHEYVVAA